MASQGHTIDEALATLAEAVELYLEEVDDPADHITVKPLPDRNRIERKPGGCESPGSVGGGCQLRRPGLAYRTTLTPSRETTPRASSLSPAKIKDLRSPGQLHKRGAFYEEFLAAA